MQWRVLRQRQTNSLALRVCEDIEEANRVFEEQSALEGVVWIEDGQGRTIDLRQLKSHCATTELPSELVAKPG